MLKMGKNLSELGECNIFTLRAFISIFIFYSLIGGAGYHTGLLFFTFVNIIHNFQKRLKLLLRNITFINKLLYITFHLLGEYLYVFHLLHYAINSLLNLYLFVYSHVFVVYMHITFIYILFFHLKYL